jgi:hypothetical protein
MVTISVAEKVIFPVFTVDSQDPKTEITGNKQNKNDKPAFNLIMLPAN